MKSLNSGNSNATSSKIKFQINPIIDKKLQSRIKKDNNFYNNINSDNCLRNSETHVSKTLASKYNRTLSMDLSNSIHLKDGCSKILQSYCSLKNIEDLKYIKDIIEVKNKNDKKKNKESRNDNNICNKPNISPSLKEFKTISNKMKNSRTNSIAIYNMGDYHTTTNNLPNSNVNQNLQNNIINTNLFNKLNKKSLSKTNSGNATNFSKYLANVNINAGYNSNKKVNKYGNTINNSGNLTMHSMIYMDKKNNDSLTKSNKNNLNLSKNAISNNCSIKNSSFSKGKEIKNKLKVSFPSYNNYKNNIVNPSVNNTKSNDFNPDTVNSLNFSRDVYKTTPLVLFKTEDEEENDNSLTDETKSKLSEIKDSIVELINKNSNKNLILKELDSIYKYVLKSNSPFVSTCEDEIINSIVRKSNISSECLSHSGSVTNNPRNSNIKCSEKDENIAELENELLKKENENLRSKLDNIDKKFEKICSENNELRDYVKEKSDNLEELRDVINSFKKDLNEVKKQSINLNAPSIINQSNKKDSDSMRHQNANFFIDDKNISIDQILDYNNNNKINIAPSNINNFFLPVHNILINKKHSEIPENDNDGTSDKDLLSDKERTACFPDIVGREEICNENYTDDSLSLDSLNRMTKLIEVQMNFKQKTISKSSDFSLVNMQNFGLNLSNLPKQVDFNQEFLENYSEFSPSWRMEVEKINLGKIKYLIFS